jgi:hypothetical protein
VLARANYADLVLCHRPSNLEHIIYFIETNSNYNIWG